MEATDMYRLKSLMAFVSVYFHVSFVKRVTAPLLMTFPSFIYNLQMKEGDRKLFPEEHSIIFIQSNQYAPLN